MIASRATSVSGTEVTLSKPDLDIKRASVYCTTGCILAKHKEKDYQSSFSSQIVRKIPKTGSRDKFGETYTRKSG